MPKRRSKFLKTEKRRQKEEIKEEKRKREKREGQYESCIKDKTE